MNWSKLVRAIKVLFGAYKAGHDAGLWTEKSSTTTSKGKPHDPSLPDIKNNG